MIIREGMQWKKNWWFLLLLIFLIAFNQKLGFWTPDKAIMIGVGLFTLVTFLKLIPDHFKQNSPKIACNPFHDTTTGDPLTAGDFTIYRLGGIRMKPFNIEGRKGAVIVLEDGENPVGLNRVFTPKCELVIKEELPAEAISVIDEHNISPPYYFGVADEESYMNTLPDSDSLIGTSTPLIGALVSSIKQKNKTNKIYRNILANKPEDIKDVIKMTKIIQSGTGVEETTTDRVKRILLRQER